MVHVTDKRKKEDIVKSIADLLGVPMPPMANGSREPKKILELVNDQLSLGFENRLSKPELAEAITKAAGLTWTPDCWSRPQTLTRVGLLRVEEAVRFFLTPIEP